MEKDPRALVSERPMAPIQIAAVVLCVVLNALDGFDVLSISFASPGVAAEWGIDRAALGIVLSMELIGMAAGSVVLGSLADRWGRRPIVLFCLTVMAAGMGLAAVAPNVGTLSAYRLITGLGIGGMLATTNAVVAEFANARRRQLAVALMAGGYPLGAIVGGSISSLLLLDGGDWRAIFVFGAIVATVLIPVVWFFLPETVAFLVERRPTRALERTNAVLRRIGADKVGALPEIDAAGARPGVAALFQPALARTTILLTFAYFAHVMTFYFILKWIPKIVVDMGFEPALAGSVLVWANVGGALGALALSLLTQRYAVRSLVIGAMLLAAVLVTLFGRGQNDLAGLSLMAGAAGFFTNAAIVGLYAVFAQSFPTAVRAGGTGFVVGIGRGGSALGPILAGYLFQTGVGLQGVAVAMAMGSLLGALALLSLRAPATSSST